MAVINHNGDVVVFFNRGGPFLLGLSKPLPSFFKFLFVGLRVSAARACLAGYENCCLTAGACLFCCAVHLKD